MEYVLVKWQAHCRGGDIVLGRICCRGSSGIVILTIAPASYHAASMKALRGPGQDFRPGSKCRHRIA
jgi:hypothetical protein